MEKTKQLTHGAMFLSIIGALTLINRALSFFFDPYVAAIASLIGIIYMYRSDFKFNMVFAIGMLIIAFLFGGQLVSLYMPISVMISFAYSNGMKKQRASLENLFISIIIFVLGEFIITLIILPILGYDGLKEITSMLGTILSEAGLGLDGLSVERFAKIAYLISIILIGIMEATLVHLMAIIAFRKLKINYVKKIDLRSYTFKPWIAYVLFIFVMGVYFINYFKVSDFLYYLIVGSGLLSSIVLFIEGIFYFSILGQVRGKNYGFLIGAFILFFFPVSYIIIVVVGFLYLSGPLKRNVEVK